MECEHCNKTFSTKYNLTAHQKKSKSCRQQDRYVCDFCSKPFSSNERLKGHMATCSENSQKKAVCNSIIASYEAKIESLERQLKDKTDKLDKIDGDQQIREKLKLDLNADIIRQKFHSITDHDIRKGQEGVARFVISNILKDSLGNLLYKCVDRNRQKFVYYDTDGNRCIDYKARELIHHLKVSKVLSVLEHSSKGMYNMDNLDEFICWSELMIKLLGIRNNKSNQDFRRQLVILTS